MPPQTLADRGSLPDIVLPPIRQRRNALSIDINNFNRYNKLSTYKPESNKESIRRFKSSETIPCCPKEQRRSVRKSQSLTFHPVEQLSRDNSCNRARRSGVVDPRTIGWVNDPSARNIDAECLCNNKENSDLKLITRGDKRASRITLDVDCLMQTNERRNSKRPSRTTLDTYSINSSDNEISRSRRSSKRTSRAATELSSECSLHCKEDADARLLDCNRKRRNGLVKINDEDPELQIREYVYEEDASLHCWTKYLNKRRCAIKLI